MQKPVPSPLKAKKTEHSDVVPSKHLSPLIKITKGLLTILPLQSFVL